MIWGFIQNQMLGMKWLNELIGKILTVVTGVYQTQQDKVMKSLKK